MLTRTMIIWLLFVMAIPIQGFCANLKTYQATYNLYWHGIKVGNSTQTLQKLNANRYLVEWTSLPLLSFLPFHSFEKSEFYLKNNQIYPIAYHYKIQNKKKIKSGEMLFNQMPSLPHKAQDKISLYFQFRQDLALQKNNFRYTVIEPEKIKHYTFKVINETHLKSTIGVLKTIQVEYISDNKERLTKVWLAKDLDYLIVKLQQFKKGKLIAESTLQHFQDQASER